MDEDSAYATQDLVFTPQQSGSKKRFTFSSASFNNIEVSTPQSGTAVTDEEVDLSCLDDIEI